MEGQPYVSRAARFNDRPYFWIERTEEPVAVVQYLLGPAHDLFSDGHHLLALGVAGRNMSYLTFCDAAHPEWTHTDYLTGTIKDAKLEDDEATFTLVLGQSETSVCCDVANKTYRIATQSFPSRPLFQAYHKPLAAGTTIQGPGAWGQLSSRGEKILGLTTEGHLGYVKLEHPNLWYFCHAGVSAACFGENEDLFYCQGTTVFRQPRDCWSQYNSGDVWHKRKGATPKSEPLFETMRPVFYMSSWKGALFAVETCYGHTISHVADPDSKKSEFSGVPGVPIHATARLGHAWVLGITEHEMVVIHHAFESGKTTTMKAPIAILHGRVPYGILADASESNTFTILCDRGAVALITNTGTLIRWMDYPGSGAAYHPHTYTALGQMVCAYPALTEEGAPITKAYVAE